jgi:hypothetical protein
MQRAARQLTTAGVGPGPLRYRNRRAYAARSPAQRGIAGDCLGGHCQAHTYSGCFATAAPPSPLDVYASLFEDDLDTVSDRLDSHFSRSRDPQDGLAWPEGGPTRPAEDRTGR